MKGKRSSKLDKIFWRRIKYLIKIIFSFSTKNNAIPVYSLLFGARLAEEIITYFVGTIPSKFYKVLIDKDRNSFYKLLGQSLGIVTSAALSKALSSLSAALFSLSIRGILTRHLQNAAMYQNHMHFLVEKSSLDNPDQRMTQDVDKFADAMRRLFEQLVVMPLLIAYYTYKCWDIVGYIGPVSVVVVFLIGAVCCKLATDPLAPIVYKKERKEGNFRFIHHLIRRHIESITFHNAVESERKRLDNSLNGVLSTQRTLAKRTFFADFTYLFFSYFGAIQSYLLIAVPLFAGAYNNKKAAELGSLISQTAFVSIYLINCFTNVLQTTEILSEISGYTDRITEFLDSIATKDAQGPYWRLETFIAKDKLVLENLTVMTPDGKLLFSNLNLTVVPNRNLLISGPNGCGKTSLMRVMAGIWQSASGRIGYPNINWKSYIMFVPQLPYLIQGSLCDQIHFPRDCKHSFIGLENVRHILTMVGLEHLEERMGGLDKTFESDWNSSLSSGEKQRISFARIFVSKPAFAVLDEATNSIPVDVEFDLYKKCRDLGITCITIGHRMSLRNLHQELLMFDGDGGFELQPL